MRRPSSALRRRLSERRANEMDSLRHRIAEGRRLNALRRRLAESRIRRAGSLRRR